ncbi:DUF1206 domain-containing protein [Paeniglutamicibacter kerguelensis]|uniref:Protein-S-isoprenylcysteine O-methyltransferase Ste14/uncharacterized membrane protein n=1 Tax=Paeniglutamicibacter kerguelensis TaxID=254788 RepID=A0ABS4XEP8_9MICC|nr:DUF1206 domain-containing protein [Paeniglutamicibacter kerguelensis]MBP2386154.1 protein-S-isoprenylcysteine O-methyltransferase Ste14/uncharacterized membrane protein [Paeniglutamicibacter kerguelensis]
MAIKKELKGAADAVEDASNSRVFVVAARTGFTVSGILHVLIGIIAIQLAFGKAREADQGGAMGELAAQPAGHILLWMGAAACAALGLWQLSEVVFGYRNLKKKTMLQKKLSAAGQGLVFLVLAVAFASFAAGQGKDSGETTSDSSIQIMKAPFGPQLLIAVGVVVAVVGIVFAVRGMLASFTKQLDMPASKTLRMVVTILGVVGYVAKGIALFLVGLLFIVTTMQASPEESTGLDGALKAVREQPYGLYLLTLVGAGLICYGFYQIAKSKFVRM